MLHVVEQGECLSSIAARFGFHDWRLLWNDPQNEELKTKRQDPNILFPGDLVFIPLKPLTFVLPTGKRHVIVIKRPSPETLRLRLLDALDVPRDGVRYELVVDGEIRSGQSNADGEIVEKVRPRTVSAQLFLGEGDARREYRVSIGHLDPADTISGAQARLTNLGLDPGPIDGKIGPLTSAALHEFQELMGLESTGELDDKTISALKEQHGR